MDRRNRRKQLSISARRSTIFCCRGKVCHNPVRSGTRRRDQQPHQGNFDGTPPGAEDNFQKAFDNWNTTQGAKFGGDWKLKIASPLDVIFKVMETPVALEGRDGLDPLSISVFKNFGYKGPPNSQLVWTQATYASNDPGGHVDLNPPSLTLDTASASNFECQRFLLGLPFRQTTPHHRTFPRTLRVPGTATRLHAPVSPRS